eukprot:438994-Alexandrium_andersonii.AAC.1
MYARAASESFAAAQPPSGILKRVSCSAVTCSPAPCCAKRLRSRRSGSAPERADWTRACGGCSCVCCGFSS